MGIFDISRFMPHGHCYLWRKDILLLNVIPDIIISLCYFLIPVVLFVIIQKRKDIPFKFSIYTFIIFIFFCSLTHIMEIINVWYPFYYLAGIIKLMTSIVSILAVIVLARDLKSILRLPTLSYLNSKIQSNMYHTMENLPVGVIVSNSTGKIKYANKYILNLFDYKAVELLEKEVEILIESKLHTSHIKQRDEYFNNPIEKTMGGGRILKGITKNGEVKELEIGLRPLENNESNELIIAIKDITSEQNKKRELDQSNALLKNITVELPSMVAYLNLEGKYIFVNHAYTKYWGKSYEEMINTTYKELIPNDYRVEVDKHMEIALKGKPVNFNTTVQSPLLGELNFNVHYIPHIENGEVKGIVSLAHDQTEILQVNKQLEDYAFLLSHDLRAPVRHIKNFTELFAKSVRQNYKLTEKEEQFISVITESTNKIHKMILGMLKLASIYQQKINMKSINAKDYLNSILSNFENIKLELKLGKEEFITDTDIFDHIIYNLIENSIKFKSDQPLSISITLKEEEDNLYFIYEDNGEGIDEDLKELIFTSFKKSENSNGLGLGLNIVKNAVQKLGGEITLEPSSKGVKFKILLSNLNYTLS